MNKQKNTLFLIALAIPVLLATSLLVAKQRQPQESRPSTLAGRSSVFAPHGMIATSQPLATTAGLKVLQNGGNAVDAAVTALAVLCLVEPHMTGIGGDVFAIYWSAEEQRLTGLNASGRSGSLMTREELVERGFDRVPGSGLEAVTVPGAISGWAALLERFGTITLAEALQPVIRLAEKGFPVSPIIAGQWANQTRKLLRDEGSKHTWLIDGVRSPREGEMFRNPDLAASFRLIADKGPEVFYRGELGQKIVSFMEENGGFLTLQDLRDHSVEWVAPVGASRGDYTLWELPPNGQGIAALEMLRILETYELKEMGHNSAEYLHHLVEAKKLAFADLARYVGDPDHLDVPPEYLISDRFIEVRRALLDPKQAAFRQDPGPAVTSTETVYLTVADAEGNMISFINSVFDYFGSGVTVPGTGFTLQNRGQGFTMDEGLPNTIAPRKRPFHTLIPAFVTHSAEGSDREEPWLSFGVMGGSMQPQGHIQVLLNMLLFDMDPQEAIDAPRFRHLSGLRIVLESPIGDEVRQALEAMGHVIGAEASVAFGGAQAIMRLAEGWSAGSDPRKDGMAAGY